MQFDDYNPAKIFSHPGVSTVLSPVKPKDILVTDFFGGVASVEITPMDQALDPLARHPAKWQAATRKSAGRVVTQGLSVPDRPRPIVETNAWIRPLEKSHAEFYTLRFGVLIMIVIGAGYLLLRPENKHKTE